MTSLDAATVAIARVFSGSYSSDAEPDSVFNALARVADQRRWGDAAGPFGRVISPGARVVIKPNLVLHQNEGTAGLDCLVTSASLIQATVKAALQADPAEVLVGDAPIQSCDFPLLLQSTGLDSWADELSRQDLRFKGIRDFRRTSCSVVHGVRRASENRRPEDQFALFDLSTESLLEPVSHRDERFRVAWYDPRLMAEAHTSGVHRYLVAKEVLEADVVINLPKLKTHKKAGITCALKNLIGINGNKEYLPHHRLGGSESKGDCYPGKSKIKGSLEYVIDRQNLTDSVVAGTFWHGLASILSRVSRLQGDRIGVDGSWSGNDTIWRTCLDLNRILLYGTPDGSMAEQLQRRVIHVVDAVIAGQGEGPLAPDPLPLGLILAGDNPVAIDWVAAHLLAYNPSAIPLLRNATEGFRWPLTSFVPSDVGVTGDLGEGSPDAALATHTRTVRHPLGWRGLAPQQLNHIPEPQPVHWDA